MFIYTVATFKILNSSCLKQSILKDQCALVALTIDQPQP